MWKNCDIPCKTDDSVDIYITAKDDMGINYSSLAESWRIGENGSIESGAKINEMGIVEIK